jgi:hypothetical protein
LHIDVRNQSESHGNIGGACNNDDRVDVHIAA